VARRLFFDVVLAQWFEGPDWRDGQWQPVTPPAWVRLGGLLPVGRLGDLAWQDEMLAINAMAEAARACGSLDQDSAGQASSIEIDLQLTAHESAAAPAWRLAGNVSRAFPLRLDGRSGWQLLRVFPSTSGDRSRLKGEDDLHFGERVPMFLEWAALRLQCARVEAPLNPVRLTCLVKGATPWCASINAWDASLLAAPVGQRGELLAELEQRVLRLLGWWRQAQQNPELYFPRSSWKAVARDDADDIDGKTLRAIRAVWQGGNFRLGERDHGAGYNRLLGGEAEFDFESDDLHDLLHFAHRLKACISLDPCLQQAAA
jgi:exodeoxyribonuclease V gamma subunit